MRLLMLMLAASLLGAGCATQKSSTTPESGQAEVSASAKKKKARPARTSAAATAAASNTITNGATVVTLTDALSGKVAGVNTQLRFVVLDFALNPLPARDTQWSVYRQGAKVGELRVSGPQYNNNIVADLIAGEAQVGDVIRPN